MRCKALNLLLYFYEEEHVVVVKPTGSPFQYDCRSRGGCSFSLEKWEEEKEHTCHSWKVFQNYPWEMKKDSPEKYTKLSASMCYGLLYKPCEGAGRQGKVSKSRSWKDALDGPDTSTAEMSESTVMLLQTRD